MADRRGWTTAEAAARTGISVHTLRFYERAGLMATAIRRTDTGRRRYSDNDLAWIGVCTRLRETGMSVELCRRYAQLVGAGDGNETERLALLEAHREHVTAELEKLTENLRLIDYKITTYRHAVAAGTAGELWTSPAARELINTGVDRR